MPKLPHSVRLAALLAKMAPALDEEEMQLIRDAAQTAVRLESGQGFSARGVVSRADSKPYIDCTWMGMLAQITPEQARSIAAGLVMEAAEAETDATLLQFFQETGLVIERAAEAVNIVRSMRAKRSQVIGEKQEPPGDALQNVVPFGKPS